jgi:serine/threonine protein kinase
MIEKKPRCPNGYNRQPPKKGICVKKNKTLKKNCENGKILNPKTNRCINDNVANRKRLNLTSNMDNISSIHCKKYGNIQDMDLEKLSVVVKANSSSFGLKYNKVLLDNIKFLSSGSYGDVYKYSKNNYAIAIKTYKYKDDDEIRIINMLKSKKIPCEVINSRLLKIGGRYVCAMELMSGPLSKMNGKLKIDNYIRCIKNICKHLKCLNDHGLSYTDLKTANVLFKCIDKKNIKIVMGDVGSICKSGQMHIATWPPWEYRNDIGHVKCNESTMVWCLGVILTELFDLSTTVFYWDDIYKFDDTSVIGYIETVCRYKRLNDIYVDKAKKHSLEKLYKDMLNLNPKKRVKLNAILKRIDI